MDQAAAVLRNFEAESIPPASNRRNSEIGQIIIQRALNCIQVEDLSTAVALLQNWEPLDQTPSALEKIVTLRQAILLAKVLRFQGVFDESLTHIEKARAAVEQCKYLSLDDDLRDLASEHADTLLELGDPVSAEQHLHAEVARRDQNNVSSGRSALQLSLAEALFAQKRFREAEQLCFNIQSQPRLLKFEKLRLQITLAKIRHAESDNEGALSRWSEAMKEIGKFHMTNGRTTRIIVLSICDTLSNLGQTWLMRESMKQVATLDETEKPGGVQYWIAGMRHWSEYLQSRSLRSHM